MPAPLVKWVMMKSSKDMVNASRKPESTPGMISGNTTLKNAYMGEAPKSRAASYVYLSVIFSFGMTLNMT